MRINEICYVARVAVGLLLLSGITLSSGVDYKQQTHGVTTSTTIIPTTANLYFNNSTSPESSLLVTTEKQDEVPNVVSLETKTTGGEVSSKKSPLEVTTESGKLMSKDPASKTTTDGKKKLVTEFKQKTESKYQKIKDDEKPNDPMKSSFVDFVVTTTPISSIEKISEIQNSTELLNIPLLVRGQPISNETEDSNAGSRGRALNISASEPTNSLHANLTDLSDVSMDDQDKEVEGGDYVASKNRTSLNVTSLPIVLPVCMEGNKSYAAGEKVLRGCEESCVCSEGGKITDCKPRCVSPKFRAGRNKDPYCREQLVDDDECCAVLVCADSEPEPDETCIVGNQTFARGQRVEHGCSQVCICEAGGALKCQPRCPPNETTSGVNQHDRCVALTDPRDPCCTITLCDVTLGDHEIKAENSGDLLVNLTNIKVLNSTTIKLKLSSDLSSDAVVEISENNHVWRQQKPDKSGIITNLEPAHSYFVRITEGGRTGPALQVILPAEVIKTNITEKVDKSLCSHRGKTYKIGAQWYDECISLCVCGEGAKTECITIECPWDFGLDVLNPHCLDWETVPANFVPKAPKCCPEEVRCRNNGSCLYEGISYDNWSELPTNVTGCEKRCYCDMGNVSCQAACPPVAAHPPANLPCPSNQVVLAKLPDDDCCSHWVCDHSMTHSSNGIMDVTTAYPGPLATDNTIIDNTERTTVKPLTVKNISEASTTSIVKSPVSNNYETTQVPNDEFHYPMDPGHPTTVYNGPYSPDYKPIQANIDQVFHLSPHTEKPTPKEKTKSKMDAKKPLEPVKVHKEINTQQQYGVKNEDQHFPSQRFPGPLAPEKFPQQKIPPSPTRTKIIENPNTTGSTNKLASTEKNGHPSEQPQFIPLKPYTDLPEGPFVFVPTNGENIPPTHFVNQYENPDAGPPYGGPALRPDYRDPNFVSGPIPKKKPTLLADSYSDDYKTKPGQVAPGKSKAPPHRNPQEQEILPEELYHLIQQQHPGLTHLEHAPPQGHSDLYDIHRQITAQKDPATYFGQIASPALANNNKNNIKPPPPPSRPPHIVSQKDENGQTTYHVHTSEVPNSPQQIEELLAHISQHDSNLGPFQRYPGQNPITHTYQTAPGPPPTHLHPGIGVRLPDSSATSHLNHPFAAQASPNQSVMDHHNVPPGFSILGSIPGFPGVNPSHQTPQDEVSVKALEALDDGTIRIVFTVPPVFVGLQARVELRYTSDKSNLDPSTWKSQIFIPPNDLIATPQLEFELDGLEPSTDYKVRVTVNLRGLANSPSSKIYSVRTLDRHEEIPTLPPQIPVDAELRVVETNSTWINLMWKKFTEYEMQFIDGVQLRYKEHDSKVYAATPLIHRAVTNYVIENLKPATNYEIGISIIPFPGQTTELISEKTIQVLTAVEPDPYAFDVKVEIKSIKSTAVEVSWTGVPYPEDKHVNIYRAIYQSDSGKEDTSTFKIAKRDSPAKTVITDLKPGTRYRLWIEVYLTNGRIKKSNVQDFVTKPGVVLPAGVSQQGKLASLPLHEGDYYGPLVIVAIVASLSILSTLILLMMLMKRRSSSKADISPRKTTAAYDNPSYKTCEDAEPITNGRSKSTDHEMATISDNSVAKETA
ncbi:putative epidermal cell surface receptor [Venturia canescens]|uniref:putative epidermal cell surface receptor n=1 Tax=Venturia canescens TaxID=32260 RepID=UPI001C9D05FB|nr:putative epidermal cell surface receptor [Venturia canescens]